MHVSHPCLRISLIPDIVTPMGSPITLPSSPLEREEKSEYWLRR